MSSTTADASFDKPLPALPQPYFEYMFASTGSQQSSKKTTSYSSLDDYVDTDPVKRPSPRNSSFDTEYPSDNDYNEDIGEYHS